MRKPTRLQAVIIGLALVAAGAAAVAVVPRLDLAPEYHKDGEGPLGAFDGYGESFDANVGGPTWTVGMRICKLRADQSVVLDGSVRGASVFGDDFQYLGAVVREFTPSDTITPVYGMDGFPPAASFNTHPAKGYTVTTVCRPENPNAPYTELMLGFGRGPLGVGGGWQGTEVGYNAGPRHHVVTLNYQFFVCGSAAWDGVDLCR